MKFRGFAAAAAVVWSLPGFAQDAGGEMPAGQGEPMTTQDAPNIAEELKTGPAQGMTQDVSRVADELKGAPAAAGDVMPAPATLGGRDQVKSDPRKSDGVYADAELLGITPGGKSADAQESEQAVEDVAEPAEADATETAGSDAGMDTTAEPVAETADAEVQSPADANTADDDAGAAIAEPLGDEATTDAHAETSDMAGSSDETMADEAQPTESDATNAEAEDLAEDAGDIADEEAATDKISAETENETVVADPPAEEAPTRDAEQPDTTVTTEAEAPSASEDTGSDPGEAEMADAEPTEPDPLDVAAATCLDIAGPANAGVPAAAVDAATQKATLARAAEACTEAATAEDADPEVLFHAAAIAQSRGAAGDTFDLLTRAAKAGLGAAETRLGDYFLFGVGPEGQDVTKAVGHYQAAQEKGDAAGMTTLALLYQLGRGVPRDPTRMVELMTDAADLGYHFAQYRLAQTYLSGDGIPGRTSTALGIPDTSKAVRYYTMAADAGNLSAALELSALYADPESGLPDDPDEQVRLTRMVSSTGHPPAIAQMGTFYETGRGVDYDPAVAAGLYARAMESGKVAFDDLRNGAPATWDRDTALEFQKILQSRGLYDGPLDAIIGGGTAAGARRLAGN
ncbi:MAG: hypothetical protein CMH11_15475 [Maritimibacter sp.]|nr:hypothetical protein [Maritimibacter sp.]